MPTNTPMLSIRNLSFSFDSSNTISDFSLDVEKGSFTTLLGPSGCGKTTLLRLIAGFLEPKSGAILIDGKNQSGIPTNLRKIGMVFQDYALFPHMTVRQNLLYGLNVKKHGRNTPVISADEKNEKITGTAKFLYIDSLLDRFPHQLSGGQQQRVALGRALVLEPSLLLMDEPLSSLDAKLRAQVKDELRDIQKRLGITTVYVTHDQDEALSVSDKIAVINKGRIQQQGTPREVYFSPANRFTADFVGRANFLSADENTMVRPEWISVQKTEPGTYPEDECGRVSSVSFLGATTMLTISTPMEKDGILTAQSDSLNADLPAAGDFVHISITRRWHLSD